MNIIQKHILVSACSIARSPTLHVHPQRAKDQVLPLKLDPICTYFLPNPWWEHRTRRNIRICWFPLIRITANQWVFYWTLFSFSNCFFTWASSLPENSGLHLCRFTLEPRVSPVLGQSSLFLTSGRGNHMPFAGKAHDVWQRHQAITRICWLN